MIESLQLSLDLPNSLIRRVLGRQDVDVSNAPLELPPSDSRERARAMVMGLQDEICAGLEALDGESHFHMPNLLDVVKAHHKIIQEV